LLLPKVLLEPDASMLAIFGTQGFVLSGGLGRRCLEAV